jgi:hypothetical protein
MLIVTIAALVMSASLGWFAYRLMREEQRRSEARVAVLTAALDHDDTRATEMARAPHVGFAAPAAAPVARQVARVPDVVIVDDARQPGAFRSERPVVDDAPTIDAPLQDVPAQAWMTAQAQPAIGSDSEPSRQGGLFGETREEATTDMRRFIALGGLVLVALIAVAYLLFGRPSAPVVTEATTTSVPAAAAPVAATGIPLELRGLAHERKGDVLVVRGRVANPVAGSARASLVASVMLLDQAGGFLGSARTPIDASSLRPGAEAGFAVELPAHKDGRRYRVTFRGPDGALVPHVDKR